MLREVMKISAFEHQKNQGQLVNLDHLKKRNNQSIKESSIIPVPSKKYDNTDYNLPPVANKKTLIANNNELAGSFKLDPQNNINQLKLAQMKPDPRAEE